ncbi:MAG: pantetheine-phosphate adenylyltransferase [Akkermansiaceae bacterium]|nr:pantetheine-phosphate adenylyltransferase [Armatimonadota bacterium]
MPNIAIYPGSFDPATNGHADVIARASRLFDRVIIAVGRNSQKQPLFSVEERVALLQETCQNMTNVTAEPFDGMLVDFARGNGAKVIIKGLRAVSDFEYEFQMALANRHLAPDVETLFLMTSAHHLYLSSSIVKEIARLNGDLTALVPDAVAVALRAKFALQPDELRSERLP